MENLKIVRIFIVAWTIINGFVLIVSTQHTFSYDQFYPFTRYISNEASLRANEVISNMDNYFNDQLFSGKPGLLDVYDYSEFVVYAGIPWLIYWVLYKKALNKRNLLRRKEKDNAAS